jgi:methyl coenzyme M reductase subunit C
VVEAEAESVLSSDHGGIDCVCGLWISQGRAASHRQHPYQCQRDDQVEWASRSTDHGITRFLCEIRISLRATEGVF